MRAVCVAVAAVLASSGAASPLYLSDVGYTDHTVGPPVCYLPYLDQPFSGSRQIPIGPQSGTAVGAQWGAITFFNQRDPVTGVGHFDALIDTVAVAGRVVTVTIVDKTWDAARQIWIDANPVSGGLVIFSGIALNWVSDGDTVSLNIRDNLALLERPLQQTFYAGTGGLQGDGDNLGDPVPKGRGDVFNATPVLLDKVKFTYQLSDAAISNLVVKEGGKAGFTNAGDFPGYVGMSTAALAAGQYCTCLAKGYFRLAAQPVYPITADFTGAFPSGTVTNNTVTIALQLLEQDCGIAAGAINVANFTAMATNLGAVSGGIYTAGGNPTPIELLGQLAGPLSCAIGADLDGKIDIFQMFDPSGGGGIGFTVQQILPNVQSIDMPEDVAVPVWRLTYGYEPNETVQQRSDLNPTVGEATIALLGKPYLKAIWSSSTVKARYPTALDEPVIQARLGSGSTSPQNMVNFAGTLWGVQRSLYDIPLPLDLVLPTAGALCDLGDPVEITYPVAKLAAGAGCVLVGMTIDVQAGTVVLRVFL